MKFLVKFLLKSGGGTKSLSKSERETKTLLDL